MRSACLPRNPAVAYLCLVRPMSSIPELPPIHSAILSSFVAAGLTPLEALQQPRRAEVILRHDPFESMPYIVTLCSPAIAAGEGEPVHADRSWFFATFDEARACFEQLYDADVQQRRERARISPPDEDDDDAFAQWQPGDAEVWSRLVPYDVWRAQHPTPRPFPKARRRTGTRASARRTASGRREFCLVRQLMP
jgi:hypothetical protein